MPACFTATSLRIRGGASTFQTTADLALNAHRSIQLGSGRRDGIRPNASTTLPVNGRLLLGHQHPYRQWNHLHHAGTPGARKSVSVGPRRGSPFPVVAGQLQYLRLTVFDQRNHRFGENWADVHHSSHRPQWQAVLTMRRDEFFKEAHPAMPESASSISTILHRGRVRSRGHQSSPRGV